MKKCISLFLSLALCLGLSVPAWAAEATFTDVPATHWSYSFVERAAENGWVAGVGNNQFAPDKTLTFAEFYTMVTPIFAADKMAEYQAPAGSAWWQSYMHVGAEFFPSFIISKESFYGGPAGTAPDPYEVLQNSIDKHADEAIPRSDAITIMWQVLEENGLDDKVPGVDEAKTKVESINGYLPLILDTAVPVCYAAGLVSGDENGNLNLDSSLTRAEGCVMLCNLVDYVTEHGGDVATKPTNPSEPTEPTEPADPGDEPTTPSTSLGQKLSSGATAAAGVLESIGKNDAYPTYGNSDVVSNNGYFTGATDVEIGNARLQYEFLDLVNKARAAEGHAPLTWVGSDSAEEHTLQRCYELVSDYSHNRPKGKFAAEVIANGYLTAQDAFNGWMNSPGHKLTLMSDTDNYMTAAKVGSGYGSYWIICMWADDSINLVERFASNNYDYSEFIDG